MVTHYFLGVCTVLIDAIKAGRVFGQLGFKNSPHVIGAEILSPIRFRGSEMLDVCIRPGSHKEGGTGTVRRKEKITTVPRNGTVGRVTRYL